MYILIFKFAYLFESLKRKSNLSENNSVWILTENTFFFSNFEIGSFKRVLRFLSIQATLSNCGNKCPQCDRQYWFISNENISASLTKQFQGHLWTGLNESNVSNRQIDSKPHPFANGNMP